MRASLLAIGVLAVMGLACSSPPTCTAQNCATGCCSTTGQCLSGGQATACGSSGNACVACGANQVCQLNVCADTGTHGGSCNPTNCTGCCSGNVCVTPAQVSNMQCGTGGNACADCVLTAATCSAGACVGGTGDGGTPDGGNGNDGGHSDGGQPDGGSSCGAQSCGGCCVQNICVPFVDQNGLFCGQGGAACLSCNGGTCANGSCSVVDAGSCGAGNCNGCCINTTCVPVSQEGNQACGLQGAACGQCTGTTTCQNGTCTAPDAGSCGPANCPGGCCAGNLCIPLVAESDPVCGFGGNACVGCASGTTCTGGFCAAPDAGSCTFGSCLGCCFGNICVDLTQESAQVCGLLGFTCTACTGGATCQGGQCVAPPPACDASSCAGGCCAGNTCVPYQSQTNTQCGTNGQTCGGCSGALSCSAAGVCQVPIGSPCTGSSDCTSLGPNSECKLTTSFQTASYPGGMCTIRCSTSSDCPSGTCSEDFLAYGESDRVCLPTCFGAGTCGRTGYDCYNTNLLSLGECWISPPPNAPTATSGEEGRSCTANTQCGPPPYDGTCILASTNGFTGGYCSASCSVDPTTHCGSTGVCVDFGNIFFPDQECRSSCSGPMAGQSNCRAGYVCEGLPDNDGGTLPTGYCTPNCHNSGSPACLVPLGCASNGYCCDDAGSCQ